MIRILTIGLLLWGLTAATGWCGPPPREELDRKTGATLTIAADPYIYARDEPGLAAHARDYLNLYAVEINTAGKRSYYLVGFSWSTIDRREDAQAGSHDVALTLDDRRLPLKPSDRTPRDLGIGTWPLTRPSAGAVLIVYPVDLVVLRQLRDATHTTLRPLGVGDADDEPMTLWRDGRPALQEFLARL